MTTINSKLPPAYLEDILNFSSDSIISIDGDGKIALFNAAAQLSFGYSDTEILGQPLEIILPNNNKKDHKNLIDKFANSKGKARTMAARRPVLGKTKKGNEINLSISIQKHPEDWKFRYTAICRDVTELANHTKALEYKEEKLILAQKIAKIGHWEWDIKENKLTWSDEVFRIFGINKDEVTPSYEKFLEFVHPDDRSRLDKIVGNSVKEKKSYNASHRINCPDGTQKIIHEIGEVTLDEKGEVIELTGTAQDITEAWEREQEIRKAQLIAEESNHAKGLFMATMSHELRTPLNAIIGFSTILKADNSLKKNHAEYASYIEESGQHLLNLVNNILNITKVELDNLDYTPTHFDIPEFINTCLKSVQHLSNKKNITLKSTTNSVLPMAFLDKTLCKQILINLITNSIKFSNGKQPILIKTCSNKNILEIKVIDHGIGIHPEKLETIFEPFTQADMELSRKYDGGGLGLTIVKNLTEFMGGTITISSKLDIGTTVTISLPAFTEEMRISAP